MKEETKSSLKTITIAFILMVAVFFALYKMDQANTHSHDGGAAHSH